MYAVIIAGGLFGALGSVLLPAVASSDVLYRFVDSRGVVHFSNVPTDQRFVRVQPEGTRAVPMGSERFDELIARVARQYELPPALVKAVIASESNFDPAAISAKGAQGLMQLMPATAREMGVEDSFHAEDNVRGGSAYLRELIDRYGDWRHALAAYNAGPTAVEHYGGIPPFPETREYVRRVLKYYRAYDVDFM